MSLLTVESRILLNLATVIIGTAGVALGNAPYDILSALAVGAGGVLLVQAAAELFEEPKETMQADPAAENWP